MENTKPYYIECAILFIDEIGDETPFQTSENYQYIFDCVDEESARKKAEKESMKSFKEEYGEEGVYIIRFEIETIHETSGDARI